jgi:hypothetical protein
VPHFSPKPLSYTERLVKAHRTIKAAQYRADPKLQVRELCEGLVELTTALLEREQVNPDTGQPVKEQ